MQVQVSIGELVDKITILEIKKEKFTSGEKLANVKKEYKVLKEKIDEVGISTNDQEYKKLKEINLKLWDIENEIRKREAEKNFDKEFIELARKVYFTNDERSTVKKRINLKYDSDLIEEKEYTEYD